MTSTTETKSKVVETINSMDYNTGYQYSATGSGITASGNLSPGTGKNSVTIDGVTSTWTGINSKPTFTQTTPGAAFQFTETYIEARIKQSNNYSENNRSRKYNNYNKYFLPVILSLASIVSSIPAKAEVGGVSATAAPVANSSGSVTNQAIQVLQAFHISLILTAEESSARVLL